MKHLLKSSGFKILITSIIILLASYGLTRAGAMSPSASPAPTSYTLNDIYTRLVTNAVSTEGDHSLSTTTLPAPSFHTLTEVYDAIPTIDPAKVLNGTTYLGVAGTASAGNATVPGGAPIQPAQAFVDVWAVLPGRGFDGFDLSSLGIVNFSAGDGTQMCNYLTMVGVYTGTSFPSVNFSGNALNQSSVDSILSCLAIQAENHGGFDNGTLNLSGGTNATPSAQGLSDRAILEGGHGWTVLIN